MNQKFCIDSYDRYNLVLQYNDADGSHQIITRKDSEILGLKENIGAFTQESGHVFGIYASPKGPVLFCDSDRVVFNPKEMKASVDLDPNTKIHRYSLTKTGKLLFGTVYKERHGIGANPYDQEPEDVDLFQMIASILLRPPYLNYIRDWPQ